jgi:hypothetical protein
MFVLEQEEPELYDRIQEQNPNRRYELLTNCIEIGLKKGATAFDKYMLWALNHVAVANISQFGGRFREEPIYVGNHKPPQKAYERALIAADRAWDEGHLDFTAMEDYLAGLLQAQLEDEGLPYQGS